MLTCLLPLVALQVDPADADPGDETPRARVEGPADEGAPDEAPDASKAEAAPGSAADPDDAEAPRRRSRVNPDPSAPQRSPDELGSPLGDPAEQAEAPATEPPRGPAADPKDAVQEAPEIHDPADPSPLDADGPDGTDELFNPPASERGDAPPTETRRNGAVYDLDASGEDPPLPFPLVVGTQLALAVGAPVHLAPVHYLLTASTMFTWPLIFYPLVAGYGVACVGNSLGFRRQGAFFPMMAALGTSCFGWFAVTAVFAGILVMTNGGAFVGNDVFSQIALSLAALTVPLPPLLAGVAASSVWAFVDTEGLPGADLAGSPTMGSGQSDTQRLHRWIIGRRAEVGPSALDLGGRAAQRF